MSKLHDLLLEAAQWRARISNPATLESSQEAIDAVTRFIQVEDRILALPQANVELTRELTVSLDITGQRVNHAMMAGLILARSAHPSAARALLHAARSTDSWCATQARLNLAWLARTHAAADALRAEVQAGGVLASPALPLPLLVNALIHQRRAQEIPLIEAFLHGETPEAERALVLEEYVCQYPQPGIALARNLTGSGHGPLAVTALGLDAVYGNQEAFVRLLQLCRDSGPNAPWWHTALRWVGRVARPESIPVLLNGLGHPDAAARADVVTSLAWHGTPGAWQAVTRALGDPAREVADQAMSLVFDWLGDLAMDVASTWHYDSDGRLAAASRDVLANIMLQSLGGLAPEQRYWRGEPLDAEAMLGCLYIGLLPAHSWYHWVSMTGIVQPYSVHKDLLYNFPVLEELSLQLLGG